MNFFNLMIWSLEAIENKIDKCNYLRMCMRKALWHKTDDKMGKVFPIHITDKANLSSI